jgi:hypothetical protein
MSQGFEIQLLIWARHVFLNINIVGRHVHVDRGMKSTHELKEKCVVCARFRHVNIFELIKHTVFAVNGGPDLISLECGV